MKCLAMQIFAGPLFRSCSGQGSHSLHAMLKRRFLELLSRLSATVHCHPPVLTQPLPLHSPYACRTCLPEGYGSEPDSMLKRRFLELLSRLSATVHCHPPVPTQPLPLHSPHACITCLPEGYGSEPDSKAPRSLEPSCACTSN
jgi:hypothetical protein